MIVLDTDHFRFFCKARHPVNNCKVRRGRGRIDLPAPVIENRDMEIPGHIANGVVVFDGGPIPPEGTPVVVSCAPNSTATTTARITLPLIDSAHPASVNLTGRRVAELLEEGDVSS
jgi:hypothetical protein